MGPQGVTPGGNLKAAEMRALEGVLGPMPETEAAFPWAAKLTLLRVMGRNSGRDSVLAARVVLDEARRKPPPKGGSNLRAEVEANIERARKEH